MNPLPLNESSPTKRSSVTDCIGLSSEVPNERNFNIDLSLLATIN